MKSGFSLLELMVVLVIIAILVAAFAGLGGRLFDQSKRKTSLRLAELGALIEKHRTMEGDFPADRLPSAARGNAANSCSEALFLAFFDPQFTGTRPDQNWLVNTDFDQTTRSLTILPSKELFEIGDAWGNPIAYFESLHYDEPAVIMAGPEEDHFEQEVIPLRNARTGAWEKPNGFQLISAGEDGEFGTADDLSNVAVDG